MDWTAAIIFLLGSLFGTYVERFLERRARKQAHMAIKKASESYVESTKNSLAYLSKLDPENPQPKHRLSLIERNKKPTHDAPKGKH